MNKLSCFVVLSLVAACSAGPEATTVSDEEGAATSEQANLLKGIEELSAVNDPRAPALIAELKARVAANATELAAEPNEEGLGSSSQALFQGNGCSGGFWAEIFLGLTFSTSQTTFNNQCNWHDQCYSSGNGTYGLSRESCDSAFLSKMNSRCDSLYPTWSRILAPHLNVSYLNCNNTASAMYQAVRLKGSSHYTSTVCVGGQIWPATSSSGPGCSTYEPFDSSRTRVCNGASGMRADGSIGSNWNGCRGSGCAACSDALAAYPRYFTNHPLCSRNTTCAGQFYQCGSACPAPSDADR